MNIKRIKETCIYIRDIENTKAFYNGVLQLPVISLVPERHVFFNAGESVLLCFIAKATEQEKELPPHGAYGCIHFAFQVEEKDYEVIKQKIINASITILHKHTWKKNLRSFYFHDPDNNLVEIMEGDIWE